MLNDDAIVRGGRSGDREAFDALVIRFTPLIAHRLSHLGVPARDRGDVCQEVLIAATAQLQNGSFHQRAGLATWLYHIATGKAVDYHRRRATRDRAVVGAGRDRRSFTFADEDAILLTEALSLLQSRERLAFTRFYLEGLAVEDVADELGLSLSRTREILTTTKARVIRAIRGGAGRRLKPRPAPGEIGA